MGFLGKKRDFFASYVSIYMEAQLSAHRIKVVIYLYTKNGADTK